MPSIFRSSRVAQIKTSRVCPLAENETAHHSATSPHGSGSMAMDMESEILQSKYGGSVHPKLLEYTLEVVIGKGSFAKVLLAKKKSNGAVRAMKIMTKDHIVNKNQIDNIMQERELMSDLTHPFVVRLFCAFQTAKKIFMVLEFCSGGELYFHMKKEKKFSEEVTRFYTAEVALALIFLHQRGVLFRDLKAENVLMDEAGHVKLSDFGLAASGINEWLSGAHTMCGTPQYMAPETFLTKDYGFSCDWWSLGILCYEMVGGIPPFRGRDATEVFRNTIQNKLIVLRTWSREIKTFFGGILCKEPSLRLGRGQGSSGEMEIINDPFLRQVDMGKLVRMELPAPYKPETSDLNVLMDAKKGAEATFEIPDEGSLLMNDTNSVAVVNSEEAMNVKSPSRTNDRTGEKFDSYMSSLNVDPTKFKALNNDQGFHSIYASNIVSPRQQGKAGANGAGGGGGAAPSQRADHAGRDASKADGAGAAAAAATGGRGKHYMRHFSYENDDDGAGDGN